MTRAELLRIAKPLNCNTHVAKAFMDERKTQTRRLCDFDKILAKDTNVVLVDGRLVVNYICDDEGTHDTEDVTEVYSRYKKDDILWVREPAFVTIEYVK